MKQFYIFSRIQNILAIIFCLSLLSYSINAQVTEHFSDEITGTSTFTTNGFNFNLTGSRFVIAQFPTYGWTGTATDDYYVDNFGNYPPSAGVLGSIAISSATFKVTDLYVFPGVTGEFVSNSGSVIIRGKLSGATQFTHTIASGSINTSGPVDNGYTYVDLSSYNTYSLDQLEFEVTGSLRYLAIDAFKHSASASNSAPTNISLSTVSINESVPANSIVGTLSSTDPDAGNTFTYSLVPGTGSSDNASFNLSGSSLLITDSPDYETKNSYSIRVRSTDQGSLYYEKAFTISILNVNETPVIIAPASISITEDIPSALTGISFSDIDAGNSNIMVTLSSATGGTLGATSGGGVTVSGSGTSNITLTGSIANLNAFIAASGITYTTILNNIANVTLDIWCSDLAHTGSGGTKVNSTTTNLIVTAVNDAPLLTIVNTLTGGTEDTQFTITYASLATAADEVDVDGDPLSFQIEGVSTGTLTKGGTGIVSGITQLSIGESLVWTPNVNVNGIINAFTIKAWDGVSASNTSVQVQIDVTAVNDAPSVNAGLDGTITESSAFSHSGSFTDPDAGDIHTVQVTSWGDASSPEFLTVDEATKTFSFSHVYQENGVYTATIRITDNMGVIRTDQVVVTVTNLSPVVDAGPDGSVNEGSAFSQSGSFSDPGVWDTHTAKANYGDGSSLQTLTVNQAAKTYNLNHIYTNNGVYTIAVTVTDDDGGTGTDQVTVTVLNAAPTDIALSANSIDENVSANSIIGTLSTTDPGAGNTFTYTLVTGTGGTDNASFNISGSSLYITNSPDFETKSSYSVRVRTTDQGSLFYEEVFTITISDLNESPADITLSASSINENATANSTVGSLSSADPDAGNTFTYTLVSGIGSTHNASFNISGSSLQITNSPDYETKNSYSIRVRSTDQGSLYYEKGFTIIISNVNEIPVITAPASISITEDIPSALTGISFSDIDAGNSNIMVTLSSATGGTLVATSGGGVTVSGSGTSNITLTGSIANINAFIATSGITYTTILNNIANVTLDIWCSDLAHTGSGGTKVNSTTTNLTVIAVNDSPSVNAGLDGTITEGSVFSQSGSFTDPDAGDTHTMIVNWADGSSQEFLTVDEVTKTFSFSHAYTENGVFNISFRITDNNDETMVDIVTVTVTNVSPAVSTGLSGSVNEGSAFSQSGSFSDPGVADTHTATANYGDGSSVQTVTVNQAAKTFNLNHVYTDNGVYTILVTVIDDDGAIGTAQVSVTVLNVAPDDMALSANSTDENVSANSVIGTLSTTDPGAGSTFTYTLVTGTGDTDNASFNISGNSLRITNSPDFETKSSYSVRLRTTDQGSLFFEKAFIITIIDVIENVTPVVTTQNVTNIGGTGATGNGNITSLGIPDPIQYGIVWSTSPNPTIALPTKTEQGAIAVTGAFTGSITGLSVNTQYYVKAYATNSAGTSYGDEVTFSTLVTDVPGFTITTVKIYPNPATDEVNISTGNISDNGTFTLLSSYGTVIKHGVISNGEARITLEKFSSGMYILQIQVGLEKASFKIVKR